AQSIIQTALGGYQSSQELMMPGGRVYEQRNFIYDAICDIPGLSAVKPKAGFYIFPKIDVQKFNITDDVQFAYDLLKQKKILITQGTGFNCSQPDHFRIVYLPNLITLKEAADGIADFLSTYKQK
ncbi:MAG: aminotransferase class I/II-fold pyridoxal phosphate-dependent enzyme, partial [Eubacteriales bacterium]